MSNSESRRPFSTLVVAAICLIAGATGGWFWQSHRGVVNKAEIEQVIHDYLLEHPEILPDAMQALQKKQDAKQLVGVRTEVEKAWPGQVLGNPNGKITLVEFTDFACTYCRQSVEDVEKLIAANPDLKVVMRQLPIIAPESADAARMGLAAAEQGKYALFHKAMFLAGRPDKAGIEAAAKAAGVDLAKAQAAMADPRYEAELARNIEIARQLGFNGTPSWVVGDHVISGAVGQEKLAKAIADARG